MLKIIGDLCLADWYFDQGCGIGTAIASGTDPFVHLRREPSDLWIGNLECVIADTAQKDFPFVTHPAAFAHVRHFDVYGTANNHVMQAGAQAYADTLDYLDQSGVLHAGSLRQKSVRFQHQGRNIGLVAFSQRPDNFTNHPRYWCLPEYSDLKAEIDTLGDCDYRIAFVHWGNEFINYPYIDQKQFARWLVDSGIDLVVGMHPHVMQGCDVYKNKHIFYSLGNAAFNMAWEPTRYGLLVSVDFEKAVSGQPCVSTEYLHIGPDNLPAVIKDEEVPNPYRLDHLNALLVSSPENEVYYAEARRQTAIYAKENRKALLRRFVSMPPSRSASLIADFLKRRLSKH